MGPRVQLLWRLLGAVYVMFFGAGERWPVWIVVMSLLSVVYLILLSEGFSEAVTIAELVFLAGYVAVSGLGVLIRQKRRRDA